MVNHHQASGYLDCCVGWCEGLEHQQLQSIIQTVMTLPYINLGAYFDFQRLLDFCSTMRILQIKVTRSLMSLLALTVYDFKHMSREDFGGVCIFFLHKPNKILPPKFYVTVLLNTRLKK